MTATAITSLGEVTEVTEKAERRAFTPATVMEFGGEGENQADVDERGVASAPMSDIRSLIENFTNQLAAHVEGQALDRARAAVESALGVRRPGRPPKVLPVAIAAKPPKKPPRQLCPVPGCKNPAAPVFGMVCAEHKDVAKAKIKKYREVRRATKLGAKTSRSGPAGARKRRSSVARKPRDKPRESARNAVKRVVPKKAVGGRKTPKKARPKAAAKATQSAAAAPTTTSPRA